MPREPVSAPVGFGGVDGVQSFGDAMADAMMACGGLHAVPTWWPADRLASLRLPAAREAFSALCAEHLGLGVDEVFVCSTDASPRDVVEGVADFVGRGGEEAVGWNGSGAATLAACLGCRVLIIRGAGRTCVAAPSKAQRPTAADPTP